ncbi:phage/plasmid primase, P4 family [Methanosarcina mazei]|uniref:DNA primase family protein n=1 Tax=Methanosarcina mazei TaxID=2209 RepID=UPI00255428AB|nr:DNA primase family protein [Methanosarcina mazei]WIM46874.1 phage/plasmid primase, P4 family [Methanosarcina mazei]
MDNFPVIMTAAQMFNNPTDRINFMISANSELPEDKRYSDEEIEMYSEAISEALEVCDPDFNEDAVTELMHRTEVPATKNDRLVVAVKFAKDHLSRFDIEEVRLFVNVDMGAYFSLTKEDRSTIIAKIENEKRKAGSAKTPSKKSRDSDSENGGSKTAILCNDLADSYLESYPTVTLEDGVTRTYHNGVYQECRNKYIINNRMMDIAEDMGIVLTPKQIQDALEIVRNKTPFTESKTPINLIPVGNGVLDINTMELSDYSPETVLLTKFPRDYNPSAATPSKFMEMLNTTFDGSEEQIKLVQEMFGYCFLRSYFLEVIFFLIGNGRNGKTTLLNILGALLGGEESGHISNLSFKDLSEPKNENMLCDLYGRYANICGDTGKHKIKETDYIKKVTGNDFVRARKLYKDSFNFKSFAKVILAFNQLPEVDDFSDGFKRRIRIIEFNHKFEDGAGANKNIEAEITGDEEEMEGIFLWAMEGLKRILENNSFSDKRSIVSRGMEYARKSNPMHYFVRECIVESPGHFVNKADLIEKYVEYAEYNKMPQLTPQTFKKGLIAECTDISINTFEKRDQTKTGRPFGFMHIDIDLESWKKHTGKADNASPVEPKEDSKQTQFKELEIQIATTDEEIRKVAEDMASTASA